MDKETLRLFILVLTLIDVVVVPVVVWITKAYFDLKDELRRMDKAISRVEGRQAELPSAESFSQLHVSVERLAGNIQTLSARLDGEVGTMAAHLQGFEKLMRKIENLTDLQQRYLMEQEKTRSNGK